MKHWFWALVRAYHTTGAELSVATCANALMETPAALYSAAEYRADHGWRRAVLLGAVNRSHIVFKSNEVFIMREAIRLVIADVDGTLVTQDKVLTPGAKR